MDVAEVAVVIASRNRPALLRRCLDALALQSMPPAEVIVVDDASESDPGAALAGLRTTLPVTVLRQAVRGGPARARNRGWKTSRAAAIAFTDDDCRPDPGWLENLASVAASDHVVVGRTVADPDDGPVSSVFDGTFEVDSLQWGFPTCNVLYPRQLLEQLGGFDEYFKAPWGEDTDLGCRAVASGAEVRFAPAAVVFHAVHRRTPARALRETWRTGQLVGVVKRHPRLRADMYDGHFWRPYHRRVMTALAGLCLAPVSPVFLLTCEPWLSEVYYRRLPQMLGGEVRWTQERIRQAGGLALLDATEFLSCVWGSIRERTLML